MLIYRCFLDRLWIFKDNFHFTPKHKITIDIANNLILVNIACIENKLLVAFFIPVQYAMSLTLKVKRTSVHTMIHSKKSSIYL